MGQVSRFLYTVIFTVLLPLLLMKFFIRNLIDKNGSRKAGARLRIMERFGFSSGFTVGFLFSRPISSPVVFHLVSVGEALGALTLIREFMQQHPQVNVVVTTTTQTGSNIICKELKDSVSHYYLPFDLPFFVSIFLWRLKPRAFVAMETELWPNLIQACYARNIQFVLINARLSRKSFRGYKKLDALTRRMMDKVSLICAQGAKDRKRFIKLGIAPEKCVVTGNLKFDICVPENLGKGADALRSTLFGSRQVWVAASTHAGEEEIILATHVALLKTYPDLVLILVPRHPQRFMAVFELVSQYGLACARHSKNDVVNSRTQVYLLDSMGELMLFYAMSDISFIGGSLLERDGGHNPIEPASLGKAVVSGKNVSNFVSVYQGMVAAGAVVQVDSPRDLESVLDQLLRDKESRAVMARQALKYVCEHQGSTLKALKQMERLVEASAGSGFLYESALRNSN